MITKYNETRGGSGDMENHSKRREVFLCEAIEQRKLHSEFRVLSDIARRTKDKLPAERIKNSSDKNNWLVSV